MICEALQLRCSWLGLLTSSVATLQPNSDQLVACIVTQLYHDRFCCLCFPEVQTSLEAAPYACLLLEQLESDMPLVLLAA